MSDFDSGGLNVRPEAQAMSVAYVKTFELYLDDDRYAVPTLHLVPADDAQAVLQFARRMIEENTHHRGVEICLSGERIEGLGTFAVRRALPESRDEA